MAKKLSHTFDAFTELGGKKKSVSRARRDRNSTYYPSFWTGSSKNCALEVRVSQKSTIPFRNYRDAEWPGTYQIWNLNEVCSKVLAS